LAGKAFAVEGRIIVGARAGAVGGKGRLMGVDEGHALGRGIATAPAVLAERERLDPGQEFSRHEIHGLA
jgi:hypothetical protein